MAISKGLLAVLLATAAFLAGAAASFCVLQTAMLSPSFSAGNTAGCDPGFRLPVSPESMRGIDAAVAIAVAAAWGPASSLIDDAMPFTRRRLVRNLAAGALRIGVLVPFPTLPTCPAASASAAGGSSSWWADGPAGCGDCFPFARATLRRVNAVAAAVLAVACVSVYINLTCYLEPDDDEAFGGAPRRPRRN
ncbi:unnamed protein product [Urochloa humidicola]